MAAPTELPPDATNPLTAPEAIARRRATRRFDPDRPLPDDLLERLLHLATHAPSGFNLQPWRFLVVREGANRQKLRACAFNQPKITEAPVVVIILGYQHPAPQPPRDDRGRAARARRDHARPGQRSSAPGPSGRWNACPTSGSGRPRSTMLAAATLMLAAESLGVASAPMEGFQPEKVKEAFGIPDDHTVCCLVALGFAADSKPFPGRLPVAEVAYLEHFGQPWILGKTER